MIICNNQLKLIDYDGMYVKSMRFNSNNEIGHINYQHPLRDTNTVGHKLDRFSSIVIYIALEALKADPNLWCKYDNGENILFKRNDFLNPEQSDLILDIKKIPAIKELIENFIKICKGSFDSIPTLEEFILGNFNVIPVNVSSQAPVIHCQYEVIGADNIKELLKRKGHVVEIVGEISDIKISWTKNKIKCVFLNFGDYKKKCFAAVIWKEGLSYLSKQGINVEDYINKWVSITALLDAFGDRPEITIDRSIKINILKDKNEAEKILNEAKQLAPLYREDSASKEPNLNSRNKEILDSIGNSKLTYNFVKTQSIVNQQAFNSTKNSNSQSISVTESKGQKPISRNQDILNQIKSANKYNTQITTTKSTINLGNSNKINVSNNTRNITENINTSTNSSSVKSIIKKCLDFLLELFK